MKIAALAKGIYLVLLIIAALAGIVCAAVGFFGTALLTSSVAGMSMAGLIVCFAVSSALARLVARSSPPPVRARIALGTGLGTILVVIVLAVTTIFRPLAAPTMPVPVPPDARFWNLPTGSHIAYVHIRAQGADRTIPVIRVHGGPGAYAVSNRQIIDYLGQLAQDGYDLYFYDQIGSGLSARLENPEEYSVTRHVADLEAIRQTIGAEQLILIGESWGGTLVANYMAAYPERVAKAIFSSPGPINPAEWQSPQDDLGARLAPTQQQELNRLRNQPRFWAVYLLQTLNPRAAHNFVSDHEMDGFMDYFAGLQMPALACHPTPALGAPHGFGGWSAMLSQNEFYVKRNELDPRARLISNQTPVLILRGQCDHIHWDVTYQYKTTFARSTLLYFPGGGHVIYADLPDLYLTAVRAFLLDTPLPVPAYSSDQPPDTGK